MIRHELAEKLQSAIFDDCYMAIPQTIIGALCSYALDGVKPGGFLHAVLANDLVGAVGRADPDSMAALREIVSFIYHELPAPCWGSREKVAAWTAMRDDRDEGEPHGAGVYREVDPPYQWAKGELNEGEPF